MSDNTTNVHGLLVSFILGTGMYGPDAGAIEQGKLNSADEDAPVFIVASVPNCPERPSTADGTAYFYVLQGNCPSDVVRAVVKDSPAGNNILLFGKTFGAQHADAVVAALQDLIPRVTEQLDSALGSIVGNVDPEGGTVH